MTNTPNIQTIINTLNASAPKTPQPLQVSIVHGTDPGSDYRYVVGKGWESMPDHFRKAQTWASMSDCAVMCEDTRNKDYYVVSKTRIWTHRTFAAVVGRRWNIFPTPSMKLALFDDTDRNGLMGSGYFREDGSPDAGLWFSQVCKEVEWNCGLWLLEKSNEEMFAWLDLNNVKFRSKPDAEQNKW